MLEATFSTRSVKAVLEALDHLDHPCALEIHSWIARNRPERQIGVTTVYRALKKLVEDGAIRPLSFFEGEIRYDKDARHQHFVCTTCKRIEVLESCDVKVKVPRGGFQLLFYNFDMFGFCSRCAARKNSKDN